MALVAAAPSAWSQETQRVTASMELEVVEAVLRRVAKLFDSGFGRAEADKVAQEIDALPSDSERSWSFDATYQKAPAPFSLRARIDDLSMVDFDFTASPRVATQIRKVLDEATAERER